MKTYLQKEKCDVKKKVIYLTPPKQLSKKLLIRITHLEQRFGFKFVV